MQALIELNPEWIGLTRTSSGEGMTLVCPTCGPRHCLAVYFSNPLDGKESAPWQGMKWEREGDTFDTLTISPSINYPCFHGWIEDGKVFHISESPMRVHIQGIGLVALSPRQSQQASRRAS
jgi:hypothetical protein